MHDAELAVGQRVILEYPARRARRAFTDCIFIGKHTLELVDEATERALAGLGEQIARQPREMGVRIT